MTPQSDLPSSCVVCGALIDEVGEGAIPWSPCPLLDEDEQDGEPDAWEMANCLDELLSEAETKAWIEEMNRKVEAGEIPRSEPPPEIVAAMERIRAEFPSEPKA